MSAPAALASSTWTPLDCVSLNATAADYINAVEQVRAAGMNMLRVAGPFVYEADAFLDLRAQVRGQAARGLQARDDQGTTPVCTRSPAGVRCE